MSSHFGFATITQQFALYSSILFNDFRTLSMFFLVPLPMPLCLEAICHDHHSYTIFINYFFFILSSKYSYHSPQLLYSYNLDFCIIWHHCSIKMLNHFKNYSSGISPALCLLCFISYTDFPKSFLLFKNLQSDWCPSFLKDDLSYNFSATIKISVWTPLDIPLLQHFCVFSPSVFLFVPYL